MGGLVSAFCKPKKITTNAAGMNFAKRNGRSQNIKFLKKKGFPFTPLLSCNSVGMKDGDYENNNRGGYDCVCVPRIAGDFLVSENENNLNGGEEKERNGANLFSTSRDLDVAVFSAGERGGV